MRTKTLCPVDSRALFCIEKVRSIQKFQGRRNLQMQKRIFTSESVTEGHPDKVCDQISDGVLDAILAQDPKARVACECCATTGMVMVMVSGRFSQPLNS